jgi:metal-responsive CopG/Arc/MetJ family transcriptional regulator
MGILSMRIDDDLEQRLAREAERERRSRSEVVRDALSAFLSERERQRFQTEIARAAQAIDPSESRAVAEEALPLDNEALHASEPAAAYRAARKGRGRKR